MKSGILALVCFTTACTALSGQHLHGRDRLHFSRHQHLARTNSSNIKRRLPSALYKRKSPIGEGDTITQPSNLADGSFGSAQGCTCWHTISPGEVCLGLIDKSSSGFDIDAFHKFNPQVNSDCSNLVDGQAYCVDNGPNDTGSSTNQGVAQDTRTDADPTTTPSADPIATPKQLAHSTTSTSNDTADSEECEDDEDSEDAEDGEDDCDDSDDSDENDEDDCDESDGEDSDGLDAPVSDAPVVKVKVQFPATSTSSSAQSAATGTGGGGKAKAQFNGVATYYYQNNNAGNCGKVNPDSANIVALYTDLYNNGAHCGQQVKLTNTVTGATAVATVADSCPSCSTNGNIDCSVSLFDTLSNGNMGLGVLNVDWQFL